MKIIVTSIIRCYQKLLSPRTGLFRSCYYSPIFNLNPGIKPGCRQNPSCSDYCIEAVTRYGVLRGLFKSLARISRCL
ncbi:MAG: membrane protein insertion efficiency factor YidD [Patescibacteria group bacterium]